MKTTVAILLLIGVSVYAHRSDSTDAPGAALTAGGGREAKRQHEKDVKYAVTGAALKSSSEERKDAPTGSNVSPASLDIAAADAAKRPVGQPQMASRKRRQAAPADNFNNAQTGVTSDAPDGTKGYNQDSSESSGDSQQQEPEGSGADVDITPQQTRRRRQSSGDNPLAQLGTGQTQQQGGQFGGDQQDQRQQDGHMNNDDQQQQQGNSQYGDGQQSDRQQGDAQTRTSRFDGGGPQGAMPQFGSNQMGGFGGFDGARSGPGGLGIQMGGGPVNDFNPRFRRQLPPGQDAITAKNGLGGTLGGTYGSPMTLGQQPQLGIAQLGQPFGGQPGQPFGSQPGQPFASQPGQPFASQPGQPFGSQPEQPFGSQPGQPFASQPGQPFGSQPGQSHGAIGALDHGNELGSPLPGTIDGSGGHLSGIGGGNSGSTGTPMLGQSLPGVPLH